MITEKGSDYEEILIREINKIKERTIEDLEDSKMDLPPLDKPKLENTF